MNQKSDRPPIGNKMVLQLLQDVMGGSSNQYETLEMSRIANDTLAELVVNNPKLKAALNASTTVEEAIVDINGKDSFKNAFNVHFKTHEVLTCSNLGTKTHNVAVNVKKNGDSFEFLLCNRGEGSKDAKGDNRTYYSVTVSSQTDALNLMKQLIECKKIDDIYSAFDNAGKASIKTDIPTPPTQRMGNCGLASKLAAIKALCFEEDSTQGGTVNGESSPTYRDFRDALKAAAESYIQVNEDLSGVLQERQDFKHVTKALKEQLAPEALPQGNTKKGTAIFNAFTTAIDKVKGHANAVSELNRLHELLGNEVNKLKEDLKTETEGMGKLKLKSDINQCVELYNLLLDLRKVGSTDTEQKLSDLKTNTIAIDTVYTQLMAIPLEGVNPTTGEGVPELMTKFKQALMTINGSMDEEIFDELRPMIQETSTRIFTALGGKIDGTWYLSGNAEGLQLLVHQICYSTTREALAGHLGNIDSALATHKDIVNIYDQLSAIKTEGVNQEDTGTVNPLMDEFKGELNRITDDETFKALRPMIQETSTHIFTALGGKIDGRWELSGNAKGLQRLVFEINNSTTREALAGHLGKIDKASTTYNDLVDLNTKLDSITTAEGMMDFLTKNYGDSKASVTPSMVRDTAPSEVPTLTFNSLSEEKLNLLLDQIKTILNQFEDKDGNISLNNKSDGTRLSEEEKTLVMNLLKIYNQLIKKHAKI